MAEYFPLDEPIAVPRIGRTRPKATKEQIAPTGAYVRPEIGDLVPRVSGRRVGLVEPVGPFESFINSAYKSLVPNNISAYQALFSAFDAAKSTEQKANERFPSEGISGFLGSVAGGIVPTAAFIVAPPLFPIVMAHFGLQAMGTARMTVTGYEEATGKDVSTAHEAMVTLGFGAAVFFAERLGGMRLQAALSKMGQKAFKELGEAAATKSIPIMARAFARHMVPTAITMGLWEGTEETAEQLATNVLSRSFDEDQKILAGVPQAFLGGAIGGAFLAPLGAAVNILDIRMSRNVDAEAAASTIDDRILETPRIDEEGKVIEVAKAPGIIGIEGIRRKAIGKPYTEEAFIFDEGKGTFTTEVIPKTWTEEHVKDNSLRDFLTKFIPANYVAGLNPKELLRLGNDANALRDASLLVAAQRVGGIENAKFAKELVNKNPRNFAITRAHTEQKAIKYREDSKFGPEEALTLEQRMEIAAKTTYDITDEFIQRQLRAAEKTGIADTITIDPDINNRGFDGATHREGDKIRIDLGNTLRGFVIGHELYHAYAMRLYGVDPKVTALIDEGIKEFGGDEFLADKVGEYYAGEISERSSMYYRVQSWLKRFWRTVKGIFGDEYAPTIQEELGNMLLKKQKGLGVAPLRTQQELEEVNIKALYEHAKKGDMPWEEKALVREFRLQAVERKAFLGGLIRPHTFKSKDAQEVWDYYEKSDAVLAEARRFDLKTYFQKTVLPWFRRTWLDTSANIKGALDALPDAIGHEAILRHDLIAGATGDADVKTGRATKEIFNNATPEMEILIRRIVQSERTIVREQAHPEALEPGGIEAAKHQALLKELEQMFPEDFPEAKHRADVYYAELAKIPEFALEGGLITREQATAMYAVGVYSPFEFLKHIDPIRTYELGGKPISIRDSGFPPIKEGSEDIIVNDLRLLLGHAWMRIASRVKKNEAGRALWQIAEDMPDNGIIRKGAFIEEGFSTIGLFIDGKEQQVTMPTDLAREWITKSPDITHNLAEVLSYVSGARLTRATATGYNPGWALTNPAKDIAHAWLVTQEYSTFIPLALYQFAQDFRATAHDTFYREGAFIKMAEQGGLPTFLSTYGAVGKVPVGKLGEVIKGWKGFLNVAGWLGNTSEIWTRLAVRHRTIENLVAKGMSREQAELEGTYVARNMMDFNQGGSGTKAVDTVLPYTNAGVVATRAIFRAVKENPALFTLKVAQLGSLAAGMVAANFFINREAWDQITDIEKSNNFIFTTPLYYKDSDGNRRYYYFRVPKDHGQKIITTIFEAAAGMYVGDRVDASRIVVAAKELLPLLPDSSVLPPTIDGMLGAIYNKDFWRGEDIWKGLEVKDKGLEYTSYTNPAYIKLAAIPLVGEHISPERTRYLVERLFVRGNPFSQAIGVGFRQIIDQMPDQQRDEVMGDMLTRMPFIDRVLRSTPVGINELKEIDKMRIAENDNILRQRRAYDPLLKDYFDDKTPENRARIRQFIREQPREDRNKLEERMVWYGRTTKIPNRRWWLEVASLPPEIRATAFYGRWANESSEEKKVMETTQKSIPGFSSIRFLRQFRALKRAYQGRAAIGNALPL